MTTLSLIDFIGVTNDHGHSAKQKACKSSKTFFKSGKSEDFFFSSGFFDTFLIMYDFLKKYAQSYLQSREKEKITKQRKSKTKSRL